MCKDVNSLLAEDVEKALPGVLCFNWLDKIQKNGNKLWLE